MTEMPLTTVSRIGMLIVSSPPWQRRSGAHRDVSIVHWFDCERSRSAPDGGSSMSLEAL